MKPKDYFWYELNVRSHLLGIPAMGTFESLAYVRFRASSLGKFRHPDSRVKEAVELMQIAGTAVGCFAEIVPNAGMTPQLVAVVPRVKYKV